MRKIKYTFRYSTPYITDFILGDEKNLKFEVDSTEYDTLKIGGAVFKMLHGAVDVPLNELCDGTFTPELIGRNGTVKLDPISVYGGNVRLKICEHSYIKLMREVVALRDAIESANTEIKAIADAVFGKKLF